MSRARQSFTASPVGDQTLTWEEWRSCMDWAVRRRLRGQERASSSGAYDMTRELGDDAEAIAAELLVAKEFGVYYHDTAQPDYAGDLRFQEYVIHVRWTKYPHGNLIVYEEDDAEGWYVLVVGRAPWQRVAGWVGGAKAKVQEFWTDTAPNGKPLAQACYLVPQDRLAVRTGQAA